MGCNCKITEVILGIVILVLAFVSQAWAQWVIAVAAILLIIHAFTCKNICMRAEGGGMKAAGPAKAAKKR